MLNIKSGIDINVQNGIQVIKFNNPKKKNALNVEAYRVIKKALEDAATDPNVFLTVLTGEGDYYSSGFDITDPELQEDSEEPFTHLQNLIAALIDYPKLLISVVNGPAIGLAVTTLGLCDIVYASERASFQTPFSKLGLCAEGCASYTFPRILGKSKTSEMLYVGHKMTAKEAYDFRFVSEIFRHNEIFKVWEKIQKFKEVFPNSIFLSKQMSFNFDREQLHKANEMEISNLKKCIQSDDFINSMIKFMNKKSKL